MKTFMRKTGLLLCACLLGTAAAGQTLHFDKDGRFKLAQFTDLHLMPAEKGMNQTLSRMREILRKEKPDLSIITGDVVTGEPAEKAWKEFIRAFDEERLPFTVVLGNHDAEYLTKEEIYDMLLASPHYVGTKGPEDIFGCGNCDLPVLDRGGKVRTVLYCIDSNDYPSVGKYGEYDWIHGDQIQWYRETSARHTRENGGKPVFSLAFFHIPLPEYDEMAEESSVHGHRYETPVAGADINTGLFGAFIEQGDVRGVFTGHDHENDYIGMKYDIALGFGRVTGIQAYGHLRRGGRIILLDEKELPRFETCVVTPEGGRETLYYCPSGFTSEEEENGDYSPAVRGNFRTNGLDYTYLEGPCEEMAHLGRLKEIRKGRTDNFTLPALRAEDHFAVVFEGYIRMDKRGIYKFYTMSDDGSMLYIDGREVVNNDGSHSVRRKEGRIALEKGFHRIRVEYFEDYMGQKLEVGWSSKELMEARIPDEVLYCR